MAKTEFPESILSRPVYGVLEPRKGTSHLLIADGEGGQAILDLVAKADDVFLANAHLIFIPRNTGEKYVDALKGLGTKQCYVGPTYEAAVSRIQRVLNAASNGLQIYLAGSEGVMGQAQREAMNVGYPFQSIQTEHRGSKARRMQCVHCKGITEDVTVDPFVCSHCGLNLFVRDHYSRRLAAFQGVCIDAEDPGNVPESVEIA